MIARTINAKLSVNNVPPTAVVTALFFATPSRLMAGYPKSVCEEKMLPNNMADIILRPSHNPTAIPRINGMANERRPNKILRFRYFLKPSRSNSSPAINMINNNPTVPSNSMVESRANSSSPFGPTIIPAIIGPIIAGTLSFLISIGDNKKMNTAKPNMRTGSCRGKCIEISTSLSTS